MTKKMSKQEAGRKGGKATLSKYSKNFYSEIGKKQKKDSEHIYFRSEDKKAANQV